MRRLALSAGLVFAFASATYAQGDVLKQEGGEHNIEVQFAPLGGSPISIGGIKYRHFTSATMAWRADVFIGYSSSTDITQQENDDLDLLELRDMSSEFNISLSPGIEMHLEGTRRLSPYYGGVLNIGYSSEKEDSEMQVDDDVETQTTTDGSFTLGLNAVFGFDYYIARNIYLGSELGFGLAYTSELPTRVETTVSGVDDVENANGGSFDLGPNVVGQIRLGVLF